jgi:hypothetical protein
MRIGRCGPLVVLLVSLSGTSYGQDRNVAEREAMNKVETALQQEFGPRLMSVKRDYRHHRLLVAISPERHQQVKGYSLGIPSLTPPSVGGYGSSSVPTYTPSGQIYGPTSPNSPASAGSDLQRMGNAVAGAASSPVSIGRAEGRWQLIFKGGF